MLTALASGDADVTVGGDRLAARELTGAVGAFSEQLSGLSRIAVEATPTLQTIVAVAGALAAGVCVVPINPDAGVQEREHVLRDAQPQRVIATGNVSLSARAALPDIATEPSAPALVVYTSGTTGPPKGAVLSRRAVAACLDGLAEAWRWSEQDVLAHALPLFHVHGLVLGTLGPLRFGSPLLRTQAFAPVAAATMYFAVPTMWSRLDDDALEEMRDARMLVSGSAALPSPVFARVRDIAVHELVERYGLTESLIVTAARVDDPREPGRVGQPLRDVGLRIADADHTGLGEVQLSGPTLFEGYLNRPDATAQAMTDDGWLRTGDIGKYDEGTGLRLLGRIATDLIKTGGFKVGAGEVEDALLSHPSVTEAAVTGEPDDDLGERIIAWVVADDVSARELIDHVAVTLAPHKRPRDIRFIDALPRNPMGKVQKKNLGR